jgi:hypothetical protein
MATRKKEDLAQAIMDRILSTPVPSEGQLKHPIQPKAKTPGPMGAQITLGDITDARSHSGPPEDLMMWTTRTFVDYFACLYNDATGGNYRKIYRGDCAVFQQMMKFLASNGLEKNEWTKRLVEWAFERREAITKRHGYFTPQSILAMINHFYQDVVLPKVEEGVVERESFDMSLLEEITQADSEGRATEIYARHGIPVTVQYLVGVKNMRLEVVEKLTRDRMAMMAASPKMREQLERIVNASVIGSPYPAEFVCLDWRERFSDAASLFTGENWWRDADYKGRPLGKYRMLVGQAQPAPVANP